MKKLRVAQIGIAHDHAEPVFDTIKKDTENFEIVGYFVPEDEKKKYPERLERTFGGYREMTAEEIVNDPTIDGVVIETEELVLTKYAIMAVEKGKHIHMDKPGGVKLSEFERLIELVREKKVAFSLGYMYRFNPYLIDLYDKIEKGALGEVFSIETHMNCKHPGRKRQWLELFKGGMMFFLGCHLIDVIYRIQGMPDNIIPLNRSTGIDGVTADDFGMAVFEYKNGVSFVKCCAEERGGFARRQIVVNGSKGSIEIKPIERGVGDGYQVVKKTEFLADTMNWGYNGEEYTSEKFTRYGDMMAAFAAYARGEKENPYSLEYELELYKLVLRACDIDFE